MGKIELTRKWWNALRPKDLKTPDLDKTLASVEQSEGENRIVALAAMPDAIAKVTRGLDKNKQKALLESLDSLRQLAQEESRKAAAECKAKAKNETKADPDSPNEGDEEPVEDKLFDPKLLAANIRRALRGPVIFGFALGSKPEQCALTVSLRGNPKNLMRLARTRSGSMKACCGQAQVDQDDPKMLTVSLDGPPISGVARMLRNHLHSQGIKLFSKIRVLVGGEESETAGSDNDMPGEAAENTVTADTAAPSTLDKAQQDWHSRQVEFDTAADQVAELEAEGHPKATVLRALVDGIANAVNAGRFAQACLTLDQFLAKFKPIYDEQQRAKATARKSGQSGDQGTGPAGPAAHAGPAKVGPNDAAQQQAQQDYTKASAILQPKIDDALVMERQFDSLKDARKEIVKTNAKVEAAVAAKDFVKALKLLKELEPKVEDYLNKAATEDKKYQKKGEDVTKQLDSATDAKRGEVAKTAASALTADEIKHLPTAVRNRLLTEMQKGGWTDEKKTAAKHLYSEKYLDPAFEKIDKANRKKMIEKMRADPDFKKARDNWDKLTEDERVAIMKKAIDYQADAYGIPKTTIATYSKDDDTDFGFYDHKDGKLHINANDAALKKGGFDEAIDTAVHENGHRYQATLIDDLDAGKIKPGDPLYDQAMTFKLNDTRKGFYVQPPGDKPSADTGDEYFTQPQENHSRITGEAVQRAGLGR